MSFCKDCIVAVKHEGEPAGTRANYYGCARTVTYAQIGKIEEINGVKTYVALPEQDYPKDKAILFLPGAHNTQP